MKKLFALLILAAVGQAGIIRHAAKDTKLVFGGVFKIVKMVVW